MTLRIALSALTFVLLAAGPVAAQDEERPTDVKVDLQGGPQRQLTDEDLIAELNEQVAANPADHRAWNDLGVIHARRGDYALAREAFINAVQGNPRYADYHRNLGLVFQRLDEPELAIAEFQAYRRFDELGSQDFWRLIASAQIDAGYLDAARDTYREGIAALSPDLGPEGLRLVLRLVELEREEGNDETVRDLLVEHAPRAQAWLDGLPDGEGEGAREARAVVHARVSLIVEDGKLLEESGLLAEAAERYEQAYELAPERDDVLPRLVGVYLKAGQDTQAGVTARLAREAHPDVVGTWIASGQVFEHGRRNEDALEAYQRAFDMDPDFPDLRLAIGNLLMKMGRDREAREFLREGVAGDATKPEVAYNYAVSQMREKNYYAAIASLGKVVEQRPEWPQGWLALGNALRATKQYGAAVEPYTRALELQPDAKIAYNLGICAQRAERYETAIGAYERALELDPELVSARYNLSLSLMKAERYEDAIASFQAMAEQEPGSYRVYYSMGLCYYYLGRYDEALDAYDQAAVDKETPALLNNIGLVYDRLGNKKEAQKWYQRAKEI